MKKFLLFLAACVALVACNQKDDAFNNEPENTAFHAGQVVTISASAGTNANNAPIRKINGQSAADNISFTWEENDSILVTVGTATAIFHVSKLYDGGKSADFSGTMPGEGTTFDMQFPVTPLPLATQYYAGANVLPKNVMPFEAKNCTLGTTATLTPTKAVLQLNIWDMDIEIDIVSVAMGTDGETYDTYYDLVLGTPITLSMDAQPFFLVVEPGTYYFSVSWSNESSTYGGITTSSALTFTAGECLNMDQCCLAAGTKITMADGTTKLIEDIQLGDLVRTFDHETGAISSAQICLAWKGETKEHSLDLTFASGKHLSIIGSHDLLLENTRKYVRVNSGNVASYVGKRFYNAELGTWDELVSYAISKELVDYYCIYSAKHLNCIAEGLLTCPDDVDFFLNIYELDAHLKADATQLAADMAKYGLYDIAQRFPEYAAYKEQMDALGFQYIYIAMGKGLVTRAELLALLDSNWD